MNAIKWSVAEVPEFNQKLDGKRCDRIISGSLHPYACSSSVEVGDDPELHKPNITKSLARLTRIPETELS